MRAAKRRIALSANQGSCEDAYPEVLPCRSEVHVSNRLSRTTLCQTPAIMNDRRPDTAPGMVALGHARIFSWSGTPGSLRRIRACDWGTSRPIERAKPPVRSGWP
jgi:hypothetical protein